MQPLLFTYWLHKHPVFWFTPLFSTQSVRPPFAAYPWLCSACLTYGTPYHAIGHQVLSTLAFNVSPRPSVSHRQVFRTILYFQPSSSQCDSRRCPNPYLEKLPTQPLPREAEDLPRGERYFKHVPPLTYLIYLSPKEVYW